MRSNCSNPGSVRRIPRILVLSGDVYHPIDDMNDKLLETLLPQRSFFGRKELRYLSFEDQLQS